MAKKKKYVSPNVESNDSMISKVEVKQPQDQDKVSRIVGSIFILLGIAFVVYGIYSFVKYSRTPELDESLQAPFISGTAELTNTDDITVKGIATEYSEVFVYVNDEEVGRASVNDEGNFEYIYKSTGEGKYSITIAGVKGFPKRYISPKSEARVVEVDKTAPDLSKIEYLSEVGTETFSMIGSVEADCKVSLKRGTDIYTADCDEKGNFSISSIALDEGPNVFTLEIKDKAGNSRTVDEKVRVTYSKDSDVNGEGVVDIDGDGIADLPVASGELDEAFKIFSDNNLMLIFGIISLSLFSLSSGVVVLKKNWKK